MLEIVMNNPSDRRGEGKIYGDTAYNGMFCYINGFDADGYTELKVPYDSAQAARSFYPINKYYYPEDLSDTSDAVDKRTNADGIVYFSGNGEYITDQFVSSTFPFVNSNYWAALETGLSSAYGAKITSPGTTTAAAQNVLGWAKCWVATGAAHGPGALPGRLVGTSVGTFEAGNTPLSNSGYVARVIRIFGSDSANAFLHVRLYPGNSEFTS